MRNKIKYIILFIVMNISLVAAGKGDLYIKVDLIPANKVKSYYVSNKRVLDTGVYNSQDASDTYNQVIARVNVLIEARKRENEIGDDPCVIEGEFTGILDYKKLKEAVERTKVELDITNYNEKSNGITMSLRSAEYKEGLVLKDEIDSNDTEYFFSAYPLKDNPNDGCNSNTIQRLEYSFELVLDIKGAKNGSISGGAMQAIGDSGKGAIKDLVTEQILRAMSSI